MLLVNSDKVKHENYKVSDSDYQIFPNSLRMEREQFEIEVGEIQVRYQKELPNYECC